MKKLIVLFFSLPRRILKVLHTAQSSAVFHFRLVTNCVRFLRSRLRYALSKTVETQNPRLAKSTPTKVGACGGKIHSLEFLALRNRRPCASEGMACVSIPTRGREVSGSRNRRQERGKPSLRFDFGCSLWHFLFQRESANNSSRILLSAMTVWISLSPIVSFSQDTLTLMTSNLLNYTTSDASRDQYYRTILRHVRPDILVTQEMTSQGAVDNYYNNVVNLVFPGQYSQSTFNDGPDSDNELYFRATKFTFVADTAIRTAHRDINEFKIVHTASAETLRVYSVHLRSSTGFEAERAAEVDRLRRVTNQLPSGKHFVVCGDFNIYASTGAQSPKPTTTASRSNADQLD